MGISNFLLFIIFSIFIFLFLFFDRFEFSKSLTVSICIPLIPRDIPKISLMLQSIAKQTVLPNEVVVALSSATESDESNIRKILADNLPKKVAWKVVSTSDHYYAGSNRNRAAKASSGDIVSFADADDEMMPRRIQLIREAFLKNPTCMCVLTPYVVTKNKNRTYSTEMAQMKMIKNVKKGLFAMRHFKNPKKYKKKYHIHHGVPSVRRDVIHTISQSNKRRGQDVEFLHNVLAHYGKDRIMLIGEPLYIYHGPHYTSTYPAASNDF